MNAENTENAAIPDASTTPGQKAARWNSGGLPSGAGRRRTIDPLRHPQHGDRGERRETAGDEEREAVAVVAEHPLPDASGRCRCRRTRRPRSSWPPRHDGAAARDRRSAWRPPRTAPPRRGPSRPAARARATARWRARVAAPAAAAISAPAIISARRPKRSVSRPRNGRANTAATANDAIASPMPNSP